MPKLTDTQLVILSAAAQRQDGAVLPLPRSLKVNKAAATTVLKSLLKLQQIDQQRLLGAGPNRRWRRPALRLGTGGLGLGAPAALLRLWLGRGRFLAGFLIRVHADRLQADIGYDQRRARAIPGFAPVGLIGGRWPLFEQALLEQALEHRGRGRPVDLERPGERQDRTVLAPSALAGGGARGWAPASKRSVITMVPEAVPQSRADPIRPPRPEPHR